MYSNHIQKEAGCSPVPVDDEDGTLPFDGYRDRWGRKRLCKESVQALSQHPDADHGRDRDHEHSREERQEKKRSTTIIGGGCVGIVPLFICSARV
jgi:hypothetical protein